MLKLQALARDTKEDLDNMRKEGIIPAVFYGPKEDATSIKVDLAAFLKAYREAGESTVIDLSVSGNSHDVLIHAIDRDPVKEIVKHVDFYVIEKGKKATVHVPITFGGESPAEKAGGILIKVMHEVEIEAMPKDLPHELHVDISVLVDLEAQILAKDITLPEGVELKTEADEVIALVQAAREEELDGPVESPDMDAIGLSEEKGGGDDSAEGDAPAEDKKGN